MRKKCTVSDQKNANNNNLIIGYFKSFQVMIDEYCIQTANQ